MNRKKVIFWTVVAVIVAAVICFLKYNPLYATIEVVVAFCIGFAAEWIAATVYDKWIKTAVTEATEEATTQSEQPDDGGN